MYVLIIYYQNTSSYLQVTAFKDSSSLCLVHKNLNLILEVDSDL
jgi:hypothetical protein